MTKTVKRTVSGPVPAKHLIDRLKKAYANNYKAPTRDKPVPKKLLVIDRQTSKPAYYNVKIDGEHGNSEFGVISTGKELRGKRIVLKPSSVACEAKRMLDALANRIDTKDHVVPPMFPGCNVFVSHGTKTTPVLAMEEVETSDRPMIDTGKRSAFAAVSDAVEQYAENNPQIYNNSAHWGNGENIINHKEKGDMFWDFTRNVNSKL